MENNKDTSMYQEILRLNDQELEEAKESFNKVFDENFTNLLWDEKGQPKQEVIHALEAKIERTEAEKKAIIDKIIKEHHEQQ